MRTDECPTPKKDVYGTKHQAKTALTRRCGGLHKPRKNARKSQQAYTIHSISVPTGCSSHFPSQPGGRGPPPP